MGAFFVVSLVLSILILLFTGRSGEILPAMLTGAGKALSLAVTLAAAYALWMGVMEVAGETGAMRKLTRLLQPVIGRIFPSAREDASVAQAIAGNFSANMLGIGNAATPPGLEAMQRMSDGSGVLTDDMLLFLLLNTSCLELLPTTVLSLRAAAGASRPALILLPTLLSTLFATLFSLCAGLLLRRRHRA